MLYVADKCQRGAVKSRNTRIHVAAKLKKYIFTFTFSNKLHEYFIKLKNNKLDL